MEHIRIEWPRLLLLMLGMKTIVCMDPATVDLLTPLSQYGETCGYEGCPVTDDSKLNIHIVPHSHAELGYTGTFDQHYTGYTGYTAHTVMNMKRTLDYTISELWADNSRTFTFSDMPYFFHWWSQRDGTVRRMVYELIRQGRLYFLGGGWGMNDEATTSYHAIIEHFTYSLRKINATFLDCGRPRVAWQAKVYGHSREFASLAAQMGFDGLFISPISYEDELARMRRQALEFLWRGSDDLGAKSDIYTHKLFDGIWSPPGFCFSSICSDPLLISSDTMLKNVKERATAFVKLILERQAPHYNSSNILIMMGQRFGYFDAGTWYENMDKLIYAVNNNVMEKRYDKPLNLMYSSPHCYLKSLFTSHSPLETKQDDFFPVAHNRFTYLSGMFTSYPSIKRLAREGLLYLQIAKQVQVLARLFSNDKKFEDHNWIVGAMQDHHIITGSSRRHVFQYYIHKMYVAIQKSTSIIKQALNKLRRSPKGTIYYRCNFNISSCNLVNGKTSFMVIYNPLAWPVTVPVRIPMTNREYWVYNAYGERMQAAIIKVPETILNIPGRATSSDHEIVFMAENVPPMGYVSYFLYGKKVRMTRSIIKKIKQNKKYLIRQANSKIEDQSLINNMDAEYEYFDDATTETPRMLFGNISGSDAEVDEGIPGLSAAENQPEAVKEALEFFKPDKIYDTDFMNSDLETVTRKPGLMKQVPDPEAPTVDPLQEKRKYFELIPQKLLNQKSYNETDAEIELQPVNLDELMNTGSETSTTTERLKLEPEPLNVDNKSLSQENVNNTETTTNEATTSRYTNKTTTEDIAAKNTTIEDVTDRNATVEATTAFETTSDTTITTEITTVPEDTTTETIAETTKATENQSEISDANVTSEQSTFEKENTSIPANTQENTTDNRRAGEKFYIKANEVIKPHRLQNTYAEPEKEVKTGQERERTSVPNNKTGTTTVTIDLNFEPDEDVTTTMSYEDDEKENFKHYQYVISDDTFIKNEYIKVTLDPEFRKVTSVSLANGIVLPLDIQFYYYVSDDPERVKAHEGNTSPGPLVFRAVDNKPVPILDYLDAKVYKNAIVEEIHYMYADWASFVLRLYKESPVLEVDWVVGAVPAEDEYGKEVFLRYMTDLQHDGIFYTDSNGRQTIKRARNLRPMYDLANDDPVAGNFYPVTSKIYIEDVNRNIRLSILNDRAQGGASLHDGEIDLMIQRRIFTDDIQMNMPVNETDVIRGKHYIYISKADYKPNKIFEKKLAKEIEMAPQVLVSHSNPYGEDSKRVWYGHRNEFTFLTKKLPVGVHLLTVEKWNDGTLLLRLENYLEKADVIKSGIKKVFIRDLFKSIRIHKVRETTLAGNMWLGDHKPMQWKKKNYFVKSFNEFYGPVQKLEFVPDEELKPVEDVKLDEGITLTPQQIRTFVCWFEYTDAV